MKRLKELPESILPRMYVNEWASEILYYHYEKEEKQ